MDFQIPNNLPTWILLTIIGLRLFGPSLAKMVFEFFPSMADKHFKYVASSKADTREFEQQKDLELLRADLKAKDVQYKQAEQLYEQQMEREKIYTEIINKQFDFLHKLADNQLLHVEASIISEIVSLKKSFETLSSYVRGGWTRDKLLNRLTDTSDKTQ